jgi:hypothetical protein
LGWRYSWFRKPETGEVNVTHRSIPSSVLEVGQSDACIPTAIPNAGKGSEAHHKAHSAARRFGGLQVIDCDKLRRASRGKQTRVLSGEEINERMLILLAICSATAGATLWVVSLLVGE